MRVNVAVLISGNGSNLQALIDATQQADYPAEITLVISNKADAYGLTRAEQAGIKTRVINHKDYASREAFDMAMDAVLRDHGIELVCLAGFMRVLSDKFVRLWDGKMLNIHPSLLPKYKGLDTHARAIAAGDKEHGATVHWVIAELDAGPVIVQKTVPILADDTPETLAQRVHVLEHQIYPEALRDAADAQIKGNLCPSAY